MGETVQDVYNTPVASFTEPNMWHMANWCLSDLSCDRNSKATSSLVNFFCKSRVSATGPWPHNQGQPPCPVVGSWCLSQTGGLGQTNGLGVGLQQAEFLYFQRSPGNIILTQRNQRLLPKVKGLYFLLGPCRPHVFSNNEIIKRAVMVLIHVICLCFCERESCEEGNPASQCLSFLICTIG